MLPSLQYWLNELNNQFRACLFSKDNENILDMKNFSNTILHRTGQDLSQNGYYLCGLLKYGTN